MLKRFGDNAGLVMRHLIVWSVEAIVLIGLAGWLPGITVTGFPDALAVIVSLATINAVVMPALFRFAVHLRPVFYPLITFILNAGALISLDALLPGWHVKTWLVSGLLALILTAVSTVTGSLLAISDDHAWRRFSLGPMRARYLRQHQDTLPGTPGFIFLEIDGLAEPVLRDAIVRG
ncbi:MAG: phage holin family protein [Thermomicrobiales bacterium]